MSRQTQQTPSIPSVFRPRQGSSASVPSSIRPLTLAELSDIATSGSHASALLIDPSVPIERYLAGADALARHGATLLRRPVPGGENLNDAFISLVKAVKLAVDVLPHKHPGWKKMPSEKRQLVLKDGNKYLEELQKCKVAIVERDERFGIDPNGGSSSKESEERRRMKKSAAEKPSPSTFSMEQPSSAATTTTTTTTANGAPARNQQLNTRGGRPLPQPSRSSSGSSIRSTNTLDYVRPDRSSGLEGGIDVRDILGHNSSSVSSSSRRPLNSMPAEIPGGSSSSIRSPFTSSPLEPFQKSHGRGNGSSSFASGGSGFVSYPTLRPAASIRMDQHQVAQGFAPRSERTSKYFQVMPEAVTAASTRTRLRDSTWGRPPPERSLSTSSSSSYMAMPMPMPGAPSFPPPPPARPLPGPRPGQAPGFPQPALAHSSSVESLAHSMSNATLQYPQVTPASQMNVVENDALSLFREDRPSHSDQHGTVSSSFSQSQAITEGGEPLRTLIVPSSLISKFVSIAEPNTRRNLETCGLLMGTIDGELLQVTDLLIPQQTATSDSCDTVDEASIWSFQESRNLTTFGWAHTHPSQSCFMSSLDLHTHASYQAMLPEAIAIVCAPNDRPSFGVFRLTSPFGLKTILTCKRPELFHPHIDERTGETVKAIYTDAVEGHIILADSPLRITDLRR